MDCEIFKMLASPLVTIIGWVVIIIWGLKQINITASKNLELQKELIRENHQRQLALEVINIYKDVAASFNKFIQSGNLFITNFIIEHSEHNKINISASNLVDPINSAYDGLCTNIQRLIMWLKIASPALPHVQNIKEAIDYYTDHFMGLPESGKSVWIPFQGLLVSYRANKLTDNKALTDSWSKVNSALEDSLDKLTDAVAKVNNELTKTYNNALH